MFSEKENSKAFLQAFQYLEVNGKSSNQNINNRRKAKYWECSKHVIGRSFLKEIFSF